MTFIDISWTCIISLLHTVIEVNLAMLSMLNLAPSEKFISLHINCCTEFDNSEIKALHFLKL